MFISVRTSGLVRRLSLISTALLAFACTASGANAQTAPQLLPYTVKLIAGGGTAVIAKGGKCPVSGFISSDAYGDGCLATEIELGNTAAGVNTPGARSAVADGNGNVFFTDYNNALVRRVDAITGIVSVVAGGGTTVAGTSSGAQGTAVKLVHPAGIAFAPNGDLYFSDPGVYQVFKIAATGGFITTSGIISLVAGNSAGNFGYAASNATTTVTLANSYLRLVYGIGFDTKGDLFMADEYYYAILGLNTNATGTNTVNNVALPAGQIWKIAGTSTGTTAPYCINGTASSSGCTDGVYAANKQANSDTIRGVYSVTADSNGNLYSGDEYYDAAFKVSSAGVLTNFAGTPNTAAKVLKRAPAGSFSMGSIFGIAADTNSNVYLTDASSGVIWRVDGVGLSQYVVAGGAATTCSAATDKYGDGCPATQATFGSSSGTGNFATATLPGPGIYGVSVDKYSNLYAGDTETNLVREVSSGTQFGPVGAGEPTQTVDIHFAAGDSPAASAYTLTAGSSNFSLGTANCTANSDGTVDCLLPITATPTALGLFTGTLQVTSTQGGVGTFPLSGTYVQSPITRTAVTAVPSGTCTGTTISTSNAVTLTATLTANGPAAPGGTVTFFSNGTAIGTPQNVVNLGSTATPVYGATLSYTFSTVGAYTITATYSGDSYFKPSTGTAPSTITSTTPTFSTSLTNYQESAVTAGGTALYSFNVVQSVYTGTITFACSGLPAGASCLFSPSSITANGCSNTSTVALSINTQQGLPVSQSALGLTGRGPWQALSVLVGLSLALLIGLRRRAIGGWRFGQMWMAAALLLAASGMVACGKGSSTAASPSGTYTITVTATGSAGTTSSFPVSLKIQ